MSIERIPRPVSTTVCALCRMDWAEHTKIARNEAKKMWRENYVDVHEFVDTPADIPFNVEARHCIIVLKETNRGPMGYQGPMGATGARG